ncbi:hypothetical protein [Agrobacterium radiobacter]|uniref:hypothetical protein n=1 Tax=Agrobacterium radiobacter TaxID=362 RepID=UPI0012D9A0B9|nr:hypothetical protein [Agrobacterium radiobacter]
MTSPIRFNADNMPTARLVSIVTVDQHAGFECTIDVRRDTVRSLTNRLVNAMSNRNHLDEQRARTPPASHRQHSATGPQTQHQGSPADDMPSFGLSALNCAFAASRSREHHRYREGALNRAGRGARGEGPKGVPVATLANSFRPTRSNQA